MGTWSHSLFGDDTAVDVRDAYKEHIQDGVSDGEATQLVLRQFASLLSDPDEGPIVWLALAETQFRLGRLEDPVRDRALEIIQSGQGLSRWAEAGPQLLAKRSAVLNRIREQLLGPQPPRKRLRKEKRIESKLREGDVISYRASNGRFALQRVTQLFENRKLVAPLLQVIEFRGRELPALDVIRELKDRSGKSPAGFLRNRRGSWPEVMFCAFAVKGVDYDGANFELVGNIGLRPSDTRVSDIPVGVTGTSWVDLASIIERYLQTE